MKAIVHTPTNNLQNSLDFYTKLGFKIVSAENPTIVSDGKMLMEINPDRYARAGVKLFHDDWEATVAALEKMVPVIQTDTGYALCDPSGTWIYLTEMATGFDFELPVGHTSVLGNFAGISLETIDISKSIDIWKYFGFRQTSGGVEMGWISFENEQGMGLSMMKPLSCPHLFFNPSLTYFNGSNNLAIIDKIRELEIPITEEITFFNEKGIADNIIIRDPGGFGYFLFSD